MVTSSLWCVMWSKGGSELTVCWRQRFDQDSFAFTFENSLQEEAVLEFQVSLQKLENSVVVVVPLAPEEAASCLLLRRSLVLDSPGPERAGRATAYPIPAEDILELQSRPNHILSSRHHCCGCDHAFICIERRSLLIRFQFVRGRLDDSVSATNDADKATEDWCQTIVFRIRAVNELSSLSSKSAMPPQASR